VGQAPVGRGAGGGADGGNSARADPTAALGPRKVGITLQRSFLSLKWALRRNLRASLPAGTLRPRDLAQLYGFQRLYDQGIYGQGQRIGFVEFAPPAAADDQAFWSRESVAPHLNTPVKLVRVDGAAGDPAALGETDLDLQYAGALAPAAALVAYLISDRGSVEDFLGALYDALVTAVRDGVRIVSISLGTSDNLFGRAGRITSRLTGQSWPDALSFAQAFDGVIRDHGLVVFVAAGDSGAYGGLPFGDPEPQPIWPAIQPAVIAVGGTQLAEPGCVRSGEEAWGGQTFLPELPGYNPANTLPQASGGGGVSRFLAAPADQAALGLPGRATPDIAAFAGPLAIVYRGRPLAVWGTSASAPIAAATTALLATAAGRLPTRTDFYAGAADVTSGNNWNDELLFSLLETYYVAGQGYDLCTGAGTPSLNGRLGGMV
jgi:subtilase family serine protease